MDLLKKKIIASFGSVATFARRIGWSESKLSRILSEKQELTVDEIKALARELSITDPAEIAAVFSLV